MSTCRLRGTVVGLLIGTAILISNFQFGLQTGWVSMMSLPAALLGFAIFSSLKNHLNNPFNVQENVFVQSVAVAVGTGPLAYGLVGVIPAIEKLLTIEESEKKIYFSLSKLMLWCIGLAFFGVFFAIPLRYQTIIKEKLPFPSGSATATLLEVLHDNAHLKKTSSTDVLQVDDIQVDDIKVDDNLLSNTNTKINIKLMSISFLISGLYAILAYFIPYISQIPFLGNHIAKKYLWAFQPSPAYFGQGIIMGLPTVFSMLLGAILGWAFLAPLSLHKGWAPGPIDDWKTGGQGWILWISLSIMIVDSIISLGDVLISYILNLNPNFSVSKFVSESISNISNFFNSLFLKHNTEQNENSTSLISSFYNDDNYINNYTNIDTNINNNTNTDTNINNNSNINNSVKPSVVLFGLSATVLLCGVSMRFIFGAEDTPFLSLFVSLLLALLLSILAVRALGTTDLNPVSGIGKISQLVMAGVMHNHFLSTGKSPIVGNLIAGAISEAGAQQAGDLLQDLKTGYLLNASPKDQFYAQIIGSLYGALLCPVIYRLFLSVYEVPGPILRIPTAVVWIDCARLLTGQGLPENAQKFAIIAGIITAFVSIAKIILLKRYSWAIWIPSGVALGVGLYNTPSFTIARFLGGCVGAIYLSYNNSEALHFRNNDDSNGNNINNNNINDNNISNSSTTSDSSNESQLNEKESQNVKVRLIVTASGLVLGEGVLSIVVLALTSFNVPHF